MNLLLSLQASARSFWQTQTSLREKIYSSLAALCGILILVQVESMLASEFALSLPVLASMGASAFLLFVVPHSPMAQPWPMFGGHMLASIVGVTCAQSIGQPALAVAAAIGVSIFCMYWLRCLHPPSAATAMIAVLGGPQVHELGWGFCYEVVAINAGLLLCLAIILNNLVPGRRYPLGHSHHPHHDKFAQQHHPAAIDLAESDFEAALARMDGMIDVTPEDLVDIYEFAVENAEKRRGGSIRK
jgi:CBS domain-containing membrane protein